MSKLPDDAPVIRIAKIRPLAGKFEDLLAAAKGNVDDAISQPGCLSAEVCVGPDMTQEILVVSRWESESKLQAFLDWHETIAHASLADYADGKPLAAHHMVLTSGTA